MQETKSATWTIQFSMFPFPGKHNTARDDPTQVEFPSDGSFLNVKGQIYRILPWPSQRFYLTNLNRVVNKARIKRRQHNEMLPA